MPGLPDGSFSCPKSQFGSILEGRGVENVGIFYDHLEYLTAVWYILCPFGALCVHLAYFWYFGIF
jgi:hypothetical protein